MRVVVGLTMVCGLALAACSGGGSGASTAAAPAATAAATTAAAPSAAATRAATPTAAARPATNVAPTGAATAAAGTGAAPAADTLENGVFKSPRFNVQFKLPPGWTKASGAAAAAPGGPAGLGTSDDSITFLGPQGSDLRLVVANTDSVQLLDTSFANITETIGFEQVRIIPDKSETRTFNGIPGYRTEADAHLKGDAVPMYLIAQALQLPGKPTMFTIFVPGDKYFEHSATMKGVLDSIEALNLRGQ